MAQTGLGGGRTLGLRAEAGKQLYDYWNALRNGAAAPDRRDVDPAALRRFLASTLILEFTGDAHLLFRIAGTTVCSAFGRELRDHNFVSLWDGDARNDFVSAAALLRKSAVGIVARFEAQTLDRRAHHGEFMLLPLRGKSGGIDGIIGHFHLHKGIENLAHGRLVRLNGKMMEVLDPAVDAVEVIRADAPLPPTRLLNLVGQSERRARARDTGPLGALFANKLSSFVNGSDD